MLTLTRRTGERIFIGETVVEVRKCRDGKVQLGITAPRDVRIWREELEERPLPDNVQLRSPEG